ncbi:unnamed protein product [Phaedon cochleariae]|uniref:Methyltransferase-like 26 n=1 Tax=Phaedon cochleariae TaxID=80249 RepID=A0A9N9S913_PHACE|nr:unnamed protein product [Phaedon cochleariae]
MKQKNLYIFDISTPRQMQLLIKHFSSGLIRMSRKINYPSADRNKTPILEVLQKHIDHTVEGKVLEISSGTGQHLAHFAPNFPKLTFQPTEVETSLFDSIDAYADDVPTKNVKKALFVNVMEDFAQWGLAGDFDYVINVNMIHVTPFSCSIGLFKNVSEALKPKGLLFTYGAYANNGVLEPQSNRDFDKNIRLKDPNCGVRDIQDLVKVAETYGIKLVCIYELPANNKCLVWKKLMENV